MAKARLNGNPDATMTEARTVLREARREAKGQRLGLRARQAAEKVWLSVSTAADALASGKIASRGQVLKTFERAWGAEGRELAAEIETSLHRGCFYSNGLACTGLHVEKYAERLGRLFQKPIRDRQLRRAAVR